MGVSLGEVRHSIRSLINKPSFTVWAMLVLALAIGANTAIFSIINAVLINPLPYRNPDNLVMIWESNLEQGTDEFNASLPNFMDWEQQCSSFALMAAYKTRAFSLSGHSDAKRLIGAQVSLSLFTVLGIRPALGRTFAEEENQSGYANVVIVSNRIWKRDFNNDPDILGKAINLDGKPYTVIGVMPPDFEFPLETKDTDLWVPLVLESTNSARGSHLYHVIARLKPGASITQAQTEIDTVAKRLEMQYTDTNAGWTARVVLLKDSLVKDVRPALVALMFAVAFVLLIACANVSNLMLVRADQRRQEMATRIALGASRTQLIRQLLTESLMLALASGVLGLLLAYWGTNLLIAVILKDVPRLETVSIDSRVMAFTFAVSLLTAIVFGLAPAVIASKENLTEILKQGGGRGGTGKRRRRFRQALVILEIYLALVLLTGAGLLFKSFIKLQQIDSGFVSDGIFTARLTLPSTKYSKKTLWAPTFQQIMRRFETIPGVQKVDAISFLPFSGDNLEFDFEIEGKPLSDPSQTPTAVFNNITAGYFETLKIPLIKGRFFTDADTEEAPKVIIINQTLAEQYFGAETPLGKHLIIGYGPPVPRQIIGVVGDVKYTTLDTKPAPQMYLPYLQTSLPFMSVVLRTNSDPASVTAALRQKVIEIDREIPLYNAMPLSQLISDSLAHPRFRTLLLGIFSLIALIMAGMGIYSILYYSVSSRIFEIGIRMALGATPMDIFRLVISEGMAITLIGEALGIAGTFAIGPILSKFLYNVGTADFTVFILTPILFAIIALLACIVPAWRASSLQPTVMFRSALN